MASDPRVRASDADRDQAAAALREHLVAGRLTSDEFDERLDKAYAARTLGELDDLMADLPQADLDQLPDASLRRPAAENPPLPARGSSRSIQAGPGRTYPAARGSWLTIGLFLLVIWVIAGTSGSLWFLWVVLTLVVLMLVRWILGAPVHRDRRATRSRRS
jgi:Flp pilus assembly protein TadB